MIYMLFFLHAIFAYDTHGSLAKPAQLDIRKMRGHAARVSEATGLKLKETILKGDILKTLHSLQFNEDDAVLFYYSGHGFNNGTPWPHLILGWKTVNLERVFKILSEKYPRFLLVMADACNHKAPDLIAKGEFVLTPLIKANYKKLFVETSAHIMVSSAFPGQIARADEKNGSHFTFHYLNAFFLAVRKETTDWNSLLSEIKIQPQFIIKESPHE